MRLATEHDVDLVLLDAPRSSSRAVIPSQDLAASSNAHPAMSPCSSAGGSGHRAGRDTIRRRRTRLDRDRDGCLARANRSGRPSSSLGTEADPALGRRDASRLLARASLLVQQVVGIVTEPVLVRTGEAGILDASRDARLLVVGLSERWRTEGIGRARLALAVGAAMPTLFVRRGLRPGGVAPSETMTRFTWTLGSERVPSPDR